MNDEAVYRTAPATQGLLKILDTLNNLISLAVHTVILLSKQKYWKSNTPVKKSFISVSTVILLIVYGVSLSR